MTHCVVIVDRREPCHMARESRENGESRHQIAIVYD
jgi:hypothetical protein